MTGIAGRKVALADVVAMKFFAFGLIFTPKSFMRMKPYFARKFTIFLLVSWGMSKCLEISSIVYERSSVRRSRIWSVRFMDNPSSDLRVFANKRCELLICFEHLWISLCIKACLGWPAWVKGFFLNFLTDLRLTGLLNRRCLVGFVEDRLRWALWLRVL